MSAARVCACGCGAELPAEARVSRLYVDVTHLRRHYTATGRTAAYFKKYRRAEKGRTCCGCGRGDDETAFSNSPDLCIGCAARARRNGRCTVCRTPRVRSQRAQPPTCPRGCAEKETNDGEAQEEERAGGSHGDRA